MAARALASLCWLAAVSAGAALPAGYYLVWADEFSGSSLDTSKWDNWLLGSRRDAVNVANAVSVSGGKLTITTYTSNSVHYTGMISTDGKFLPRYGYLEASIDYNDSPGMWSAFWMQSPWMGWIIGDVSNSGAEIDICEHRSTDGSSDISGQVQANIHWDGYGSDAKSAGSGNIGSGLGSGFHTYGWLWGSTNYYLSVDGTQLYSTGSGNSDRTDFIILSSEVQDGSWAGNIPAGGYGDLATSTTKMVVDYVRWYAPTSQVFWTGSSSAYWTNTSGWIANTARVPGTNDDVVFSTLTDANNSCTLGSNFTVRSLTFHDGPGFTLNGNTLTLGSGGMEASPAYNGITINSAVNVSANQTWKVGPWRTLAIAGPISGAGTFTKTGIGRLTLSGTNTYAHTFNVDSGSTSANDGSLCIANSAAVANVPSPISLLNNNGGSSTLQLDGTAGSVVIPQNIALNGRSVTVPAIENLAGSNALAGGLTINVGGGYCLLQSDAGTLNLGGTISSVATGTRTFTFQGSGDFYVSGSIQNGSATTVNVIKTNAGTLTLANANTFTGTTRVSGGNLRLNHSLALQNSTAELPLLDSGSLKFGPITSALLGGLSGGRDLWLTNSSFAAVALTNGNNSQSTDFGGALRGSGSLTKIGSGTLTLSGTNAYTGATTVAAGTLRLGPNTNLIAALGPLLWLTFDSVGGSVVTNLGKGGAAMNGFIVGTGATITNAGRYGNALRLNGDGSYVAVSNRVTSLDGNTPGVGWTLAMWIKTTQAGAGYAYQGDGSWTWNNTAFYLNQGNTSAGTKGGAVRYSGGWLTGNTALNDGNWHFLAITVNTNGSKVIYVDGRTDASFGATTWSNVSAGSQVWIGGTADGGDGVAKMNGLIDQVYVFDRAISLNEVRSLTNNQPVAALTNYVGKLSAASLVSIASGATLDLNGISQSIASLADVGGGGVVTNNSSTPLTLVLSNDASSTTTFSGRISDASAANAISLVKAGNSTQVLTGANGYRGTTTVSGGSLLVNGSLGTNSVTVSGGTLGGNGTISGLVTIQSAGTLSPGNNAVGTLTISNTLTFSGTTLMELNKAGQTNDSVRGLTSVTYGGALSVINLGGVLLAGDTFKLFQATACYGSFASIDLPLLGVGLAWDTSRLTNGVLAVVAAVPPAITTITSRGGGNCQLSGAGAAGATYDLQATTNLAPPVWELVTSAVADTNGWFQFVDLQATNYPQRFYRVLTQ